MLADISAQSSQASGTCFPFQLTWQHKVKNQLETDFLTTETIPFLSAGQLWEESPPPTKSTEICPPPLHGWFQGSPSINHFIHRLMTKLNCNVSSLSHLQYPPWICLLQPLWINPLHFCRPSIRLLPTLMIPYLLLPQTSFISVANFGTVSSSLLIPLSKWFFLQPDALHKSFPNRIPSFHIPLCSATEQHRSYTYNKKQ